MAKRGLTVFLKRINRAFGLRSSIPCSPELSGIIDSISKLEYEGVSHGKNEMRGDFIRLAKDFKKSTLEAKHKFKCTIQ